MADTGTEHVLAVRRCGSECGEEINVKYHLAILFAVLGFAAMLSDAAAYPALPDSPNETLVFSGAVIGSWNQTQATRCDFNPKSGPAGAAFTGTMGGGTWVLSLGIGSYKGPGTYDTKNMRNITVVLDDGSHNPNTFFNLTGAGSALITVAAKEKSGTLEALLWSDTGRSVKISGAWKC